MPGMYVGEALFREMDLDDYLRNQIAAIDPFVAERLARSGIVADEEKFVSGLVHEGKVEPLAINFDAPVKNVEEAKVEVQGHGRRMVEIDGVRATRAYPFTGMADLFRMRPNPFSSMLPYGYVNGDHIVIGIEGRRDADAIKRELDQIEKTMRDYVGAQRQQIERHNAGLDKAIRESLARRRKRLSEIEDMKDKI